VSGKLTAKRPRNAGFLRSVTDFTSGAAFGGSFQNREGRDLMMDGMMGGKGPIGFLVILVLMLGIATHNKPACAV
jgi:hypothetical protein